MINQIILFIVMCFCIFSSAFSQEKYAQKMKSLYLEHDSKKAIGRLFPTSKIKILGKKGDRLKIAIDGYVQENSDRVIYFKRGKRIIVSAFSKKAGIKILKSDAKKDDLTDQIWHKGSIEVYTDDTLLIDDLESLYATANKLYVGHCGLCHRPQEVSHFKANQWPSIYKSMRDRTPATKEQRLLIVQYLQKHAGDMNEKFNKK